MTLSFVSSLFPQAGERLIAIGGKTLLDLIDLNGAIVSIDAAGCQKHVSEEIVDGGGNDVLGLKGNQGSLHGCAKALFDSSETFADAYEESAEGHGRKEIRRCETLAAEDVHFLKQTTQWPKLKSVARVTTTGTINDKTSTETRFYVSSLPPDAERIAKSVRAHWAIENSLRWILDVAFREDDAKVRKDHAPFNLAIIRHIALNLVQNVKKKGQSVRHLRKKQDGIIKHLRIFLMQATREIALIKPCHHTMGLNILEFLPHNIDIDISKL